MEPVPWTTWLSYVCLRRGDTVQRASAGARYELGEHGAHEGPCEIHTMDFRGLGKVVSCRAGQWLTLLLI